MGREIKRVAIDFTWPLGERWDGYINPYSADECPTCETGFGGYSREAVSVYPNIRRELLTQDEVDALIASDRAMDLTHTYSREHGWQRRTDGYRPTAEDIHRLVNERSMALSCSSVDYTILEARCKRLGIPLLCATCNGEARLWPSEELKKLHEDWESIEPAPGDGWQVWETVSEGSPVTPVFQTPEDLAKYLSEVGDLWTQQSIARGDNRREKPSYENALAFVKAGWAASARSPAIETEEDLAMVILSESRPTIGPYGENV